MKTSTLLLFIFCIFLTPSLTLGQDDGMAGILKFATEDQTIEEIMKVIVENNYDFKVKKNWVFDMPAQEKENFFNMGKMDADKLRELLHGSPTIPPDKDESLPSKFDLRNYEGHSYIGPVRDQGTCGSCYAFAIAAAAESSYNLAQKQFDSNCVDFSEAFTAFCLGRLDKYDKIIMRCNGGTLGSVFSSTKEGLGYEKDFPYTGKDPGECSHMSIPTVKFHSAGVIECDDINAVKSAIYRHGAVWATVMAIPAFQAYNEGIYQDTSVECNADDCFNTPLNHAVALVGWDDNGDAENKGYWILRNSWGENWGENGYMRIRYRSAYVLCSGVAFLVLNQDENGSDNDKPAQSSSGEQDKPSEEKAMDILLK